MSNELEVAAAASAGGLVRRVPRHAAHPADGPCANCGTVLEGPWCYACGQSAEDFHRSIWRLLGEVVEGLLHLDGRLWRTMPDLMFRPGRLTRAYLEGHRAPQIPPLRLFLVVLLTIFLVGGLTGGAKPGHFVRSSSRSTDSAGRLIASRNTTFDQMTPEQRAQVRASLAKLQIKLGGPKTNLAATQWLRDRLINTVDDPERFYLILEQWAERFAILMLPVSAMLLSLVFVFQRRFYLFDHTIFSLHSLSAIGVVISASMLLSLVIDDWGWALVVPAPVHLFAHMRGVYRTSVLGTLARMVLLFIGSLIAAVALVAGLIAVGLNGMGA